jgi:hypothetical protein
MVLQTSFYKELPIALPDLFIDLARPLGFKGTTVVCFPVQKVLTTIIRAQMERAKKRWSDMDDLREA